MATQAAFMPGTQAAKEHGVLWSWLTTVDHKRIGILYGATAFTFFLIGGIEALLKGEISARHVPLGAFGILIGQVLRSSTSALKEICVPSGDQAGLRMLPSEASGRPPRRIFRPSRNPACRASTSAAGPVCSFRPARQNPSSNGSMPKPCGSQTRPPIGRRSRRWVPTS